MPLPEENKGSRRGFSIIELLLSIGIVAILAAVGLFNLVGRRSTSELNLTAQNIGALLREAQSKAMMQASSTSWSVHFDNSASPFYALFAGSSFSTSSQYARYSLPLTLGYATSTVPQNGSVDVYFAQITGAATGSSTIIIYRLQSPSSSSTISIDATGAISY